MLRLRKATKGIRKKYNMMVESQSVSKLNKPIFLEKTITFIFLSVFLLLRGTSKKRLTYYKKVVSLALATV